MVFAFSDRGFFYAGSLWPRAHPIFLVWFVYFVNRWVERKQYALACALAVWFAGAYWMLEGATAILILPLAWIAYRPQLRWSEICLALAAGALIWSPYLAFEGPRGFIDLRALLSRKNARADFDADVRNSLSNPGLIMADNERPHGAAASAPAFHWVYDADREWIYQAVDETAVGGVRGRWTFAKSRGGWVFLGSLTPGSELELKVGKLWKLIFVSMPDTLVPAGAGVLSFLFASSVLWGFGGLMGESWRKYSAGRWDWLPRGLGWGAALVLGGGAIAVIVRGGSALGLNQMESLSLAVFCVLSFLGLLASFLTPPKRLFPTQEKSIGKLQFLLTAAAFVPWIVTILLMTDNDDTQFRRFVWL